jgi:hypothetical protein
MSLGRHGLCKFLQLWQAEGDRSVTNKETQEGREEDFE